MLRFQRNSYKRTNLSLLTPHPYKHKRETSFSGLPFVLMLSYTKCAMMLSLSPGSMSITGTSIIV